MKIIPILILCSLLITGCSKPSDDITLTCGETYHHIFLQATKDLKDQGDITQDATLNEDVMDVPTQDHLSDTVWVLEATIPWVNKENYKHTYHVIYDYHTDTKTLVLGRITTN